MTQSRRSVLGLLASVGLLGGVPSRVAEGQVARAVESEPGDGDTDAVEENDLSPPSTPALDFRDQKSTGGSVTVASATLAEGGFVVIVHDDEIVGVSTYLSAGRFEDVTIDLDRPLFESGTLTATIQTDTNGNRTFDATTVKLSCSQRDEESAVVSDTATVSLPQSQDAELVFRDQVVDEAIVVESATFPEGGFIALFAPQVGDPDIDDYVEIGVSDYFEPGHYEDITFGSGFPTESGECSAEVNALLIRDRDDNRDYEFSYHFPGTPDYPFIPPGDVSATLTKADCQSE
ncbi:hypothetical protein SAMN04487950_2659 [Halogranum rubrum]|uniref:DUF7282 domain-containing protein n=1 Tax=Halogranum rubrum TaxID=553466 RepID=A0A1I4F7J2_9EURY|nr:hypothetical protein [Halogranum rubrum]SFL13489.1 hypothetical protein SAMN04487950_2659 [Halogranum rubrum]